MAFIEMRSDPRREQGNRSILQDRRLNDKQSFPVVISRSPYTSTGSLSTYHRRVRTLPSITNTNVASLTKAIESGQMNVSTRSNNRTRSPTRPVVTLPERTIRSNLTNTQRTRVPSQDRTESFNSIQFTFYWNFFI